MDITNEPKGNILIVSHDEGIRNLICRKLQGAGYSCSQCEDIPAASKYLVGEEVELILVDNGLPRDAITQLLEQIETEQKNVPVIVVTDILSSDDGISLVDQGAYDYIIQPFGLDEMVYSVQRAIEKRRLERDFQTLRQLFARKSEDQARQSYENFYRTMVTLLFALEGKDSYTAGHSRRVSDIALAIGRKLALSKKDLEDLRWGSLLHDLGKVAIDQNIVNKSGKLTPEEYASVMTHPIIGATMVASVVKNTRISEIIEYHHWHYSSQDPSQRIKGKSIPLLARIVTLADAYDAMTSDRPYRSALTFEEAVAEIKKEAGSKFDPDIVQIFLQVTPWTVLSGKKAVLVADDEESIRLLIRSILGSEYLIFEAADGQEAIEITQKQHPSLVLMDINMPGKSGSEACYELKNNPETKAVPVIMITAYDKELNRCLSGELGADGYITKPFNVIRLLETVKGSLNENNQPAPIHSE